MALMKDGKTPSVRPEELKDRFVDAPMAEDEGDRVAACILFQGIFNVVAQKINNQVGESREKSLALTHLEEALMYTEKAIYRPATR